MNSIGELEKVFSAQVLISPARDEIANRMVWLVSQGKFSMDMRSYDETEGYEFIVFIVAETREDCVERLRKYGIEGAGVVVRS